MSCVVHSSYSYLIIFDFDFLIEVSLFTEFAKLNVFLHYIKNIIDFHVLPVDDKEMLWVAE